jgi:hypothetical protein
VCEDESIDTTCKDAGNGDWFCYCRTGTQTENYQVSGVSDAGGCLAVAELCRAGGEPAGPVECTMELESRGPASCQLERRCTQPVGEAGATVWSVMPVYCSDDGSGRQLCNCGSTGYQFTVDEDGTTACDTLLEFCDAELEPNFDGAELDCQPEYQSGSSGSCQTQEQCLRSVEIADGVSIAQPEYIEVVCQPGENGGSACSCASSRGGFRLESDEPVSGIASCTDLSEICSGVVKPEVSGEQACATLSQSSHGNSCEAQMECSVPVTVDGRELQMFGVLYTFCSRADDGWSCQCDSDAGPTDVPGGDSSTSAWDACTIASEACSELLAAEFGKLGLDGAPE